MFAEFNEILWQGGGRNLRIPFFVLLTALIFEKKEHSGLCSKRVANPSGTVEMTGVVVSKPNRLQAPSFRNAGGGCVPALGDPRPLENFCPTL